MLRCQEGTTGPIKKFRSKFIFRTDHLEKCTSLINIHTLVLGRLQTNCYILQAGSAGLIVDPGDEPGRILRFLSDSDIKPTQIVATHTHFDHVLGVEAIASKLKIPFLIHKEDLPMLESMQSRVRQFMGYDVPPPPKVNRFLADGKTILVGPDEVHVIHTPGHSPGSVCLAGSNFVLTGDALFNQSIGRTDLPGGDLSTLLHSITDRLFKLDDDTIVYPGHGPETTIGDEKLTNPFVGKVSRTVS